MVANIHYRWDFIGLSTDTKPTPASSEKVVDGSTYYCSDNSKLYVWYKDRWYEKTVSGGGGGTDYTAGEGIDITGTTISVDTTTIQPKLTAGSNITISGNEISATDTTYSAGTGLALTGTSFSVDYTDTQAKLTAGSNITISDNTISATDTTYSNFTGTDGTAAGTAGLVPAPATTDAGKFLKADGTWDTAGGGSGVIELTSADYDYPTNNPANVALWLLPTGIYHASTGVSVSPYVGNTDFASGNVMVIINNPDPSGSANRVVHIFDGNNSGSHKARLYSYSVTSAGTKSLERGELCIEDVLDSLTSSSTWNPLSANQGKVLKGLIDGLAISGAGAPTTSTVGTVGKLYEDTTNGKLYICTAVSGSTYTWAEVGAGGGGSGMVELTSADYDYPAGSPIGVALWLLPDGIYRAKEQVRVYASTTSNYRFDSGSVFVISKTSAGLASIAMIDATQMILGGTSSSGSVSYTYKSFLTSNQVAQTTGTSTTNVMSQNAVTSMVFADPATKEKVQIGNGATVGDDGCPVAIGKGAKATGAGAICIGDRNGVGESTGYASAAVGKQAKATAKGSVALGAASLATTAGQFDIGAQETYYGYNSSNYRLLTGLYDPQSAHDAATKGYVDPTTDSSAPTTATVGRLGQIQIDTTNADAYMCVAVDDVTPSYTWKKINV